MELVDGIGIFLLVFIIIFGLTVLSGWIVMLLWNYLTPWDITLWQGVAATILLGIVGSYFKGDKKW